MSISGSSKRGQGSIIGAAFILLILTTAFTFYSLHFAVTNDYIRTAQEMQQLDLKQSYEQIEFINVSFTNQEELNITVTNTGSHQTHLVWLGIFDEAANTQDYYNIDFFINPTETRPNIGNTSIPTFTGQERDIQIITELGNTFSYSYPEETVGDGGEERYDWVDETCDLYPPSAKGNHSFFSAQQGFPDSIYDNVTEGYTGTGSTNITLIDQESFEGLWPPTGWSETGRWNKESNQVYNGTYSADFDGGGSGRSGNLDTSDLDCSDADAIYVDFWYRDEGCEATEFLLQYYDGTSWDTISDLGSTASEYQWLHYQEKVTDPQYFKSDFRMRWSTIDIEGGEHAYVDFVTVTKEGSMVNYELDLEMRWTGVDYDEENEWLSIYGGTMGSEDILVDVWNSDEWILIIDDLESGWNNVNVSSYLNSNIFIIRFRGGTETSDSIKDSWEIDATFLHVWS